MARRQQRTGQRERQREHRVAEAHERQVGGHTPEHVTVAHVSSHRICSGPIPRHQVFFHIGRSGRQRHGQEARALAGLDRAEVGVEAERSRTLPGGALQQRGRRYRRRQRAHRRQLREHVQVGRAGQAVGANRHANARRVEVLERRRAGAGVPIAARARDERHAACFEAPQVVRGHLDAVHSEDASVQESAILEKLHGAAAGWDPGRVPGPQLLEERPPGAAAGPDELDFFGRFRQVDAARGERVPARGRADRPKHQRRH